MKLLAASALFVFVATVAGATSQDPILGQYAEPTVTAIVGYDTEAKCTADGGNWSEPGSDEGLCLFDAENIVDVSSIGNSLYSVNVETVGSNAHSCAFEGVAKYVGTDLVASNEGDDGEVCEVTVKMTDADTVSVSNNGKCSMYCGARAWLGVDAAKRK